jgi:hypothetical protein
MYMFLSPIGMYLMFGMGIKLIKKEPDNVHRNMSDRGGPGGVDELDRGKR